MEPVLLPERYRDKLVGMLNCYDRLIFTGTLPAFCYAEGMTAYLKSHGIRVFDYTKFAEPLLRTDPAQGGSDREGERWDDRVCPQDDLSQRSSDQTDPPGARSASRSGAYPLSNGKLHFLSAMAR